MSRISENKVVRAALVLCVMMMLVAMMPHHHHVSDERVCVNYLHLSHDHDAAGDADCCGTCCGDDHGHDNNPFTTCSAHNIVIAQPERSRVEADVVEVSVPDDCHCGYCESAESMESVKYAALCSEEKIRLRPDVAAPIIEYIAKAQSPRAPDFKA